ncbi:MAG: gliding motility-associated C-terminal domain-containing protein, partial [Bacteroidota bacterium]
MRITIINTITFFIAFLSISTIVAQPTVQDCAGAVSICEPIYEETISPSGMGNVPNEIAGWRDGGHVCMDDERNSIWYRFTVNSDGDFGFLIEPNDPFDDYDWALFDITNNDCSEIPTNTSLLVSCNAAGGGPCNGDTGANGGSAWNNQGGGCGNTPPDVQSGSTALNAFIPVEAGNTYVLCISNWSSSVNGYRIDFGLSSDIGIFDTEPPAVVNADIPDECNENEVVLTFSENIDCETMNADNFILRGPAMNHEINAIIGANCILGQGFENEFTLILADPITEPGNYTFEVLRPLEIFDLCGNAMTQPVNINFDIDDSQFPMVDLGPDITECEGRTVSLDATLTNAMNYTWQDGNNNAMFSTSQSGEFNVTVVTTDGCIARDTIMVNFEPDNSFSLGPDIMDCFGATITIDPNLPDALSYTWQDGSNSSTFTTTNAGSYSVEIQRMDECIVRDTIEVLLERDLSLNLGQDTMVCPFQPFVIDASSFTGDFEWQDGSNGTSFEVSQAGLYFLNIRDQDGCLLSDSINVGLFSDMQTFRIGNDTTICFGTSADYDLNFLNGLSYTWSDGSTESSRSITDPGNYSVIVETEDCITYTGEITINQLDCAPCNVFLPNVFSPNGDLINDEFKAEVDCNLSNFNLIVFDRWGNKIFETTDPQIGWNGDFNNKEVGIGVYVYVLSYDRNNET